MKYCSRCKIERSDRDFNRSSANADGLQRYCRECQKVKTAEWRKANREQDLNRKLAWYQANLELSRVTSRQWKDENHEATRVHDARKRASRFGVVNDLTVGQWLVILEENEHRCAYCQGEFQHLEHVDPLSCGGGNTKTNVVPACASCNERKRKWDGSYFRSTNEDR